MRCQALFCKKSFFCPGMKIVLAMPARKGGKKKVRKHEIVLSIRRFFGMMNAWKQSYRNSQSVPQSQRSPSSKKARIQRDKANAVFWKMLLSRELKQTRKDTLFVPSRRDRKNTSLFRFVAFPLSQWQRPKLHGERLLGASLLPFPMFLLLAILTLTASLSK